MIGADTYHYCSISTTNLQEVYILSFWRQEVYGPYDPFTAAAVAAVEIRKPDLDPVSLGLVPTLTLRYFLDHATFGGSHH